MTRYAKEHKEETRREIVRAARRLLQSRGIEGTAIPTLMGAAGLTHGGFYAHFRSKADLVAEVCSLALRRRIEKLKLAAQSATPGAEVAAFVADYLNVEHRDNYETGCILPALGGEMARQEPEVRQALTAAFKEYYGRIAALMPGDEQAREDRALLLASGMAGALLLARAMYDPALSERIIATARTFYTDTFAQADNRE